MKWDHRFAASGTSAMKSTDKANVRGARPLARVMPVFVESLEERLAFSIVYTIAPNTTLDIFPISSIIPTSPAGMDRMEVLLTSVPGVAHGTIYRMSGVTPIVWGSGAPNTFTVGAGNNRISGGEGFRYVNNGTGNGTADVIPVNFRNATGFTTFSDSIVININSNLNPPTITTQPNPFIQIAPGATATMSVVAAGSPAPTYQWYQGIAPDASRPIAGATSASYTTPALSTIQQYNYFCRVVNSGGYVDTQTVTVQTATPTFVTTSNVSTVYSANAQTLSLSATVSPALSTGNVIFTSLSMGGVTATSGTLASGSASANFTIPAGKAAGSYGLEAHYVAPAGTAESYDNKTITINKANTSIVAANKSAVSSGSTQSVNLSAAITSSAGTVAEGTVTFTLFDGATQIGSPVTSSTVAAGAASANYTLPANIKAGTYTIQAVFNASTNYNTSTESAHTLTVFPALTPNSAALPASATTLVVNGSGFDATTLSNNVVTFPSGVTGAVSAATANTLTIGSLAGLVAGSLSFQVTVRSQTSSLTQVATVIPVVTSSTANVNATTTTFTIAGVGFSTTLANNAVSLSSGTGSLTAATRTQLTLSTVSGIKGGSLTASVTSNSQSSGAAVQVGTVIPIVNTNTATLAANATTLVLNGTGFDTTIGNNVVTFPSGVTGTVTAATATQLTITSIAGLVAGPLSLSVAVRGTSSTSVQVATVVPVVTSATTSINANVTTVTITGFGFSSTPANNTVAFSSGTGTVTAATSTQLTVSSVAGLTSGSLNATVVSNSQSSGAPVQVATVKPVITLSTTPIRAVSTTVIITGFGFSTTLANNVVTLSPSVTGSVSAATATQLTYSFTGVPPVGILSATVTVNGQSSGAAVQVATVDGTAPTASAGQLNLNGPSIGTVSVTLSEAIAPAILLSHFRIDATSGTALSYLPTSVVQNPTTYVATFSFASALADRNYTGTVIASGLTDLAGNPMAANFTFNFFSLAGDANRDRIVNIDDLSVLAQNYNLTGTGTWANGDFNGDGNVNIDDLSMLAQNYNISLPVPAAPDVASRTSIASPSVQSTKTPITTKPVKTKAKVVQNKKR